MMRPSSAHHGLERRPWSSGHAPEVRVHDHVPVVVLHAHQKLIAVTPALLTSHVDASETFLVASSSRSQSSRFD